MKIIYLPGFTKKRHPLLELLAAAAFLLGFPYGVYRLVAALLREYTNYSAAMIHVNAKIYAGVIGCACAALLLVVGFYSLAFQTVAERWGELFEDLRSGIPQEGFHAYLRNLREGGINFWVYMAMAALHVYLIIDGLKELRQLTGN